MASEHILKIPRGDSDGNFVIVKLSSNGSKPLDLALLATDGDSAWASSIRQSRISKLRSKHSPIDEAEWEHALSSILSVPHDGAKSLQSDTVRDLELSATVAGDQLTVVIRRNITGITQRLGEITLPVLGEEEAGERVELLDWVTVAVDRTSALQNEIRTLNVKYEEQGSIIQKLNKQLEDLVEAKKEHETLLFEKFQQLLNAKKLKIRDQQRLLTDAIVSPEKAEHLQAIRKSETRRLPGRSGPTKRKVSEESPVRAKSESDENISFDKVPSEEPERQNEETPPQSDVDATEDESGDEAMISAPPPSQASKGKLFEHHRQQDLSPPPQASEPLKLPPRRELPFAKHIPSPKISHISTNAAPAAAKLEIDKTDSETSDDEL